MAIILGLAFDEWEAQRLRRRLSGHTLRVVPVAPRNRELEVKDWDVVLPRLTPRTDPAFATLAIRISREGMLPVIAWIDGHRLEWMAGIFPSPSTVVTHLNDIPEAIADMMRYRPIVRLARAIEDRVLESRVLRSVLLSCIPCPSDLQISVQEARMGQDALRPPRSVRELAMHAGCSPGYLSDLAQQSGIKLAAFVRWCFLLQLVLVRRRSSASWNRVATAMGFTTQSGLNGFVRRLLNMTPTEMDSLPIQTVLDGIGRAVGIAKLQQNVFQIDGRSENLKKASQV